MRRQLLAVRCRKCGQWTAIWEPLEFGFYCPDCHGWLQRLAGLGHAVRERRERAGVEQ